MIISQSRPPLPALLATATIAALATGCASNPGTSMLTEEVVEARLALNQQDTNREFEAIRNASAISGHSLETFGLYPQMTDGKLGGKTIQVYQIIADAGKITVRDEVLVTIQGETFSLPAEKRLIPVTHTVNTILGSEDSDAMLKALKNFDLSEGQNYYDSNEGRKFGKGAAEEFYKRVSTQPEAESMYQEYIGSVKKTNPDAPKVLPGCNLIPPIELTFVPAKFTLHSEQGAAAAKENAVGAVLQLNGKRTVLIIDDKTADEIKTKATNTGNLLKIVQAAADRQALRPVTAR